MANLSTTVTQDEFFKCMATSSQVYTTSDGRQLLGTLENVLMKLLEPGHTPPDSVWSRTIFARIDPTNQGTFNLNLQPPSWTVHFGKRTR